MKFNAVLTKEQAKEMFAYLEDIFTEVKVLDIEAVRRLEKDKNSISLKAFRERCQKKRLEYVESRVYQRIARYVEIEGEPYVVEMLNVLGDAADSEANAREALVAKVRGYNEELYLDALTGAYNRRYYEDRIRKVKSHAGVAMIDLDDFKLYNDTLGHKVGDLVLRTVAEVIRSCIRKTDILIRYGGDEFILIMADVELEIFTRKLKSISRKVQEAKVPGYPRLKMSVSIGGVMSEGDTIEEAISRADHFMYMAKNKKNMVVTEENSTGGKLEGRKEKFFEDLRPKILIIDDSEMNRAILREVLGEEFAVLEAANGEEGLEYLEEHEEDISLVLLDIIMPVMDGFEVLRVMSEKNFLDNIPVIMISSEESETYVKKAYEMGAMDYINRPFDAQVVYRRVFNTIKLYAKQRRLIALVTDQIKSELKK